VCFHHLDLHCIKVLKQLQTREFLLNILCFISHHSGVERYNLQRICPLTRVHVQFGLRLIGPCWADGNGLSWDIGLLSSVQNNYIYNSMFLPIKLSSREQDVWLIMLIINAKIRLSPLKFLARPQNYHSIII
jgi:hypothetical protein